MMGVLNPYLWMWCGFYGAVLVTKMGKALGTVASGAFGLLIALNALLVLALAVGSLMMGLWGIVLTLVLLTVPIVPWIFILLSV